VTPILRCILQHYYELKPDPVTDENTAVALLDEDARRLVDIKTLNAVARRRGLDGLRKDLLSSIRGEQVLTATGLLVGAGLFTDDLRVETAVRQSLRHQDFRFRIAATYASVFYMQKSEEISCILTERIVLAEGGSLILLASRDVMTIWSDVLSTGRCSRCGPTDTPPSIPKHLDWVPRRVSLKSE
jgi:hypothetical protein